MGKVIYLMGAGASRGIRGRDGDGREDPSNIAEGLPLVKEIPKRLDIIASKFADLNYDEGSIFEKQTVSVDLGKAKKKLVEGLHWLRANSEETTIDTFAKRLFLTEQIDDYIKLKRLLSIFLLTEQLVNRPDSRYVNFFTSVLQRNTDGKLRITDDITILTWNYDSQFDIAYKYFLSVGKNQEEIDFPEQLGIDIHNSYNTKKRVPDFPDNGKRQIFKINGSASFVGDYSMAHFHEYRNGNIPDNLAKTLLWTYDASYYLYGDRKERICLLNFAWDKQEEKFEREYNQRLHDAIKDATALVIIGYTFPFFNRETDTMLLTGMQNLKNVYIQDPFPNNVKQSLVPILQKAGHNINVNNIQLFEETTQFYLPPEL